MKDGALALCVAEIIILLHNTGVIAGNGPDAVIDAAKFNDLAFDANFAATFTAVLNKYGVAMPAKIQALINFLPALSVVLK